MKNETPKRQHPTATGAGLLAHYQIANSAIDSELREQRAANLRVCRYACETKHERTKKASRR